MDASKISEGTNAGGDEALVDIGGDDVTLTMFAEVLTLFEEAPETNAMVIIGALGGTMEEVGVEAMEGGAFTKPLVASMGGSTARMDTKTRHVGAIITAGKGKIEDKVAALGGAAGVIVADRSSMVGELLQTVIEKVR